LLRRIFNNPIDVVYKKVKISILTERAMADNMEWINDFDQASGLAKESGKHVFLDFFSPG